ncbi:MAG: glycosyl hydrolase [Anaerolineaceae bacterium]
MMRISKNKRFSLLARLVIIAGFILFPFSSTNHPAVAQTGLDEYPTYLPVVMKDSFSGFSTNSKFVGIYIRAFWTEDNVKLYLPPADALAGKKHSVIGTFASFMDANQDYNLGYQLESLWLSGYLTFVNFPSPWTAYDIASGKYDTYLQNTANAYFDWVNQGGGRIAFLAPLPEMNGCWTSYGCTPTNFKLAYKHIQTIFTQQGATRDKVWWVFAPNGGSITGNEFEKYYPGDNVVDIVAFSSYNYGFCHVAHPWERWQNYDTLYEPFLDRMHVMAPGKPIIIAQTGTTAEYQSAGENNVPQKNIWLKVNYEYLSQQPQFLGILYFDYNQTGYPDYKCNWRILPGNTFTGYTEGVASPPYQYLDAADLQSIVP